MGRIAETGKLTPREVMFLRAYIKGATGQDAYLQIHKLMLNAKPISDLYATKIASRMLARIKRKVDWPRLMESAGLGEIRLLSELEARLNAMETKFYQDKVVCDVEDNGTRMQATALHARLLGKDKVALTGPDGEGPVEVSLIRRVVVKPGEETDGAGNKDA